MSTQNNKYGQTLNIHVNNTICSKVVEDASKFGQKFQLTMFQNVSIHIRFHMELFPEYTENVIQYRWLL